MTSKKAELLELVLGEYFVQEAPGKPNNPKVLEYFKAAGHGWVKDDTANAWCSAFMNWAARKLGLPSTGALLARSWLKVGKIVKEPTMGDLVIFWRESIESGYGHVAIFIRKDGDDIICLGGNQTDQVMISRYSASRVLGYRDITEPRVEEPASEIGNILVRTLKRGMKGEDVKVVQNIVGAKADGDFGPQTEEYVKLFQQLHNLQPDGIVGPRTIAVLKEKLS